MALCTAAIISNNETQITMVLATYSAVISLSWLCDHFDDDDNDDSADSDVR